MKRPATPTATAARASTGTMRAVAAGRRALPARLLHRMGGVEDHRSAGCRHDRQGAHVGDQRVVAEADAALGDQHVGVAARRSTLATTFFMSQGARNWPFLTLTTRAGAAAATSRSVWRHRKAGICRTSTTSATSAHWPRLVHVGQRRGMPSSRGRRRRSASALSRPRPRWPAALVRLALSKEVL